MIINDKKIQIARLFVRLYLNKIDVSDPLLWINNGTSFQIFNGETGVFNKLSPLGIGFDIYDILDTNIEKFFDSRSLIAFQKGITIVRAFKGDKYNVLLASFSVSKIFFLESISFFLSDLFNLL
jgi:hypothetical protein